MTRRLSIRAVRALSLALALSLAWAVPAAEAEGEVRARAFEIHYRELVDVADLVGALLSAEGRMTLRPRLDTIVVEDHPAVLARVESLIAGFDLPPRGFEITLVLFLGTDSEKAETDASSVQEFSQEIRGVMDSISDFTKWHTYELVGSRSLSGVEGERLQAELSDEYRVLMDIDSVHDVQGVTRVKFDRISLQRLVPGDGSEPRVENLYTAGMVLRVGRQHVVGAASDPNSKQALFLTLQARAGGEAP